MLVEIHRTIIADEVVFIRANLLRSQFPIAGALNIAFFESLPIDQQTAAVKSDRLAWQRHDTFAQHDAFASHLDSNYVSPLRRVENIGQAINEFDAVIFIGIQHADSLHPNRHQHILGAEPHDNDPDEDAHQGDLWVAPDDHSANPAGPCSAF